MSQLIQPSEVIAGGVARPTPADIRIDKSLISPHIQDAEYRWIVPPLVFRFMIHWLRTKVVQRLSHQRHIKTYGTVN